MSNNIQTNTTGRLTLEIVDNQYLGGDASLACSAETKRTQSFRLSKVQKMQWHFVRIHGRIIILKWQERNYHISEWRHL